MRRLHRARRRQAGALLRDADVGREGGGRDDRRPGNGAEAAPAAEGLHRGAGLPVRLLRQRHGDVGEGAARAQSAADERRDPQGAQRPPVPLRLAQPHRPCGAARREGDAIMTTRRDFLKTGGALVIAFSLDPDSFAQAPQARLPGSLNGNRMLNAWLRIDPDSSVTIFSGKIELGQGIGTALSQIAADELDVELKRISIVHGDTALTPNEGQTAGSQSMQDSGTAVRFACAEAREILLSAAAARLGVSASELKVADGMVSDPSSEKKISYWDLADDANLKKEATAQAKPKPPSEHKWVGKSVPRRDIPKKFTGGAAYVQDVRLPGMLFGRVVRPPSPDATLKSVDT